MSVVSIARCESYEDDMVAGSLRKCLDNIGGIGKFVRPGMKVALKPNLVMRKKPEDAATTHPAVVRAVALMVKEAGGEVLVAESPGGLYNEKFLKLVYSGCGLENALKDIAALNYDTSSVDVDLPDGKLLKKVTVIKPLADADIIINLPKLKTHGQMVYTGAVKNMFGAVPGTLKADYHLRMSRYDEFSNALIDIYLALKPQLTIMDAVTGMEGPGPTAGKPRQLGLLIAGENAFNVDLAALRVIKASPLNVPVLRNAMERGLCSGNAADLVIAGLAAEDAAVDGFDMPAADMLKAVEFYDKGFMKLLVGWMRPRPVVIKQLCRGCADCVRHCPAKTITMKNGLPAIELSSCIRCFCCQELCPHRAMVIKRPALSSVVFRKASD